MSLAAREFRIPKQVYLSLAGLGAAAKRGLGDPVLAELVMVRASQLNHCAFCLDMHLAAAREGGESEERLGLLAAWEEAGEAFTGRERAALALTEAVTVLTEGFVPDAVYESAAAHFTEAQLAHLIAAITVINSWNRLMVTRRTAPGETEWHS
ncbi:carboxymuconolactone decarboxylase family protein [Streptomyces sp. NBC_00083]|uniref:carboxymuconolactone decarboxylase family protein n=1 Tax=Streptomyces sp. NBC_00083 TaxID=2975647 RepID=UPI00225A7167|nr:carboxymuconolactone decarboxylase family protein [Streptomyces sp. NBC_00083]MCX5385165.1 carboxymuconolactone decarboxylase family protein [Streptomyces sp. NBC_00083]